MYKEFFCDTVTLAIENKDNLFERIKDLSKRKKVVFLFNERELPLYEREVFSLSLKTSDKSLNFYLKNSYIYFNFSVPKIVLGHNCCNYNGFFKFIREFQVFLGAPNWQSWLLKRIDISCNFEIDTQESLDKFLDSFKNLRLRGLSSLRKGKKEYCYWSSGYRTFKIYDKFLEAKKNNDLPSDFTPPPFLLRFECEWKRRFLEQKFGKNFTLGDFYQRIAGFSSRDYLLEEFFHSIEISEILDLKSFTMILKNLFKIKLKNSKRKSKTIDFLSNLNCFISSFFADRDLRLLRDKFGAMTCSRYFKYLEKHGLNLYLVSSKSSQNSFNNIINWKERCQCAIG